MITFRELKFGYSKPLYDTPFNANIDSNNFVVLLGRNGKGKSTLLKTISCIHPALDGDLLIDNISVIGKNPEFFSKKISVISTSNLKVRYMKAHEFIAFGRFPYLSVWGNMNKEDFDVIKDVARLLSIENLMNKWITECSDGEIQLLLIARALVQDTPVMLLDEATAHLDFINKIRIFQLLKKLSAEHSKTILLATHDLEIALHYADNIILFKEKELFYCSSDDKEKLNIIQNTFNAENLDYKFRI